MIGKFYPDMKFTFSLYHFSSNLGKVRKRLGKGLRKGLGKVGKDLGKNLGKFRLHMVFTLLLMYRLKKIFLTTQIITNFKNVRSFSS